MIKCYLGGISSRSVALAIALGSGATAASAQSAPPVQSAPAPQEAGSVPAPGVDTQDIIVTALRRDQRLQEAPAAISVVTGATIETAGIKNLADISKVVPSLRFEGGIRPGVPSISLRGISAVQGGDAPVSVTVDGVQVPFLSLVGQDLLDISSLELLRGPQGALYGRGAIAGALVINTRQPDDDFRAIARVTAEEGANFRGVATISGPLVPGLLSAKITGSYQHSDGLLHNITRNDGADYVHQGIVRAELLLTPATGTRIALSGSYIRGNLGTNEFSVIPAGVPGAIEDFKTYRINYNNYNIDKRKLWNVALKIDQETPIGTITSVSQYAKADDLVINDFDYTAAPQRINTNPLLDRAFNEDLRLSSNANGAFSWIIGGFYQRHTGENDINVTADPLATTPQATQFSYEYYTSTAWGAYGQATLKLAKGLTAVGAVRYDTDKHFDELTNVAGSAISGTFKAWQPSGTLKYQVDHDLMFYATYGQGFRSGGFNAANLVIPTIGAQRIFPKEISKNYEAGFKATLDGGRITVNVDAFRTDYANMQFQQTIVVPVPARFITSIPSARVNGAEADLAFHVSRDLTLSSSLSLTDGKIKNFDGTSLYVGNQVPNVYHDNEQISIDYHPRFNDIYRGIFRIDGSRRGRISYDMSENFTYKPVTFLNARMGVETDRWSLSVYGDNITNTRAPEYFSPLAFKTASARLENQPFRAGVELTVKFGK